MEDEWKSFYRQTLDKFGPSAQGVGWKNTEAQMIRFQQLEKLFSRSSFSLNDLGCGVGDFVSFAAERLVNCEYRGYDIMDEMVAQATEKYRHFRNVHFYVMKEAKDMTMADYSIASGIFNIRFKKTDSQWLQYILQTLVTMNEKSRAGFAFNVLTKYSDKEFMKDALYYADPCHLFDFCKRNFSKNVALLHDYDQYDFTVIVRKEL